MAWKGSWRRQQAEKLHDEDDRLVLGVRSWDGDPSTQEICENECHWYQNGLKPNERDLAVSRIWQNLRGKAKKAVRKLRAKDYAGPGGLEKLLKFLRRSPIARQPLPDALTRTKARTNYEVIRKALVGFFEDDEELRRHDAANRRQGANMGLWGEDEEDDWEADWNEDDESDWHESWDAALWQDGYQDESWDWSGNAEWQQQAYWNYGGGEEALPEASLSEEDRKTLEDLKEAKALVAETHRTLTQAREAIANTRFARQFYNPSKGTTGPGKGKTKGKMKGPKGKSKGKNEDGSCIVCGLTSHWWKDCPQRQNKGKSKGKGKRPAVNYVWADPWDMRFVAWNLMLTMTSAAKMVVDTGATQTAGGVEAVANFLDALREYFGVVAWHTDTHDRPWFRFGNGLWLQALGRLYVETVVGSVGIYLLDAEGVPILLGGDLLEELGADNSYNRGTATMRNVTGEPVINLEAVGGHRLLDFAGAGWVNGAQLSIEPC